jgi:hypothetical protein
MSRLLKSLISPPKPPISRVSDLQAQQEKRIAAGEKREQERESATLQRIQASRRARRAGGLNLLLSSERENAQAGLNTTLGA